MKDDVVGCSQLIIPVIGINHWCYWYDHCCHLSNVNHRFFISLLRGFSRGWEYKSMARNRDTTRSVPGTYNCRHRMDPFRTVSSVLCVCSQIFGENIPSTSPVGTHGAAWLLTSDSTISAILFYFIFLLSCQLSFRQRYRPSVSLLLCLSLSSR